MALNQSKNYKVLTPHAAVIVWNYNDRISGDPDGVIDEEGINFKLISTVSCISIQTNKSKSSPAGSFQLVLAPFKNWVSTLTAGSWCAILMSNNPITEKNLSFRDPSQVKMFGKIESVRVDVGVNNEGARQTRFLVTGTDWGHIFNNILYVDNLLNAPNEPPSIGSTAYVAIRNALFGNGNTPQSFAVKENLSCLLNIFGSNLDGFSEAGDAINRLAKSTYDFVIPTQVANFFKFVGPKGVSDSKVITRLLTLKTGKIKTDGTYDGAVDSYGYIDPFSLQGTNTFWQIMLDNSNPALNEMYNEIEWTSQGPQLTLYNRIKPFSYKYSDVTPNNIRSLFKNIKTHVIDPVTVMSVNAGTNWRDKYNFVEIKPQFAEFKIQDNWIKQKSQLKDAAAFNREGFRPFMVGTKQFPINPNTTLAGGFNAEALSLWAQLLSEWYFDTHRLLNGTLVITGQNEYIAVGNNIRFEAGLINPTANINSASSKANTNKYILAHVESVSHNFSVREDGAREYTTTIQFVRGIVVNSDNTLVGEGALDQFTEKLTQEEERNTANTVTTSDVNDPDPKKVNGT